MLLHLSRDINNIFITTINQNYFHIKNRLSRSRRKRASRPRRGRTSVSGGERPAPKARRIRNNNRTLRLSTEGA